jgi:DnaJ-class molecular chaperone
MDDYYAILGVGRSATAADVRQAYMRQARERHPDRFTDPVEKERAHELFKAITAAFNTLSNDRLRREYDGELERPRPTTPAEIARDASARGTERYEAGDYAEAANLLRVAVHHEPETIDHQLALGRALARMPSTAREAVEVLDRAARVAPQNARIQAELARALVGQGLRLRANRAAEAAYRLAPNDAQVKRALAELGFSPAGTSGPDSAGTAGDRQRRRP